MQKQGLLSMTVNFILMFFFFTGLPLPTRIANSIGITLFNAAGSEIGMIDPVGNLVEEVATGTIPHQANDLTNSRTLQANEIGSDGVEHMTVVRFRVYGNTLEELQDGVVDLINGAGPYEEKEGKRYAAYVQANYKIDFKPLVWGWWQEDSQVAVELGGDGIVRTEITMSLPDFQPSDPTLEPKCDAEEARIKEHEMEHVAVFRNCRDQLQDSLKDITVVGRGGNFWTALVAANIEMNRLLGTMLDDAVDGANCMNDLVDALTEHGLVCGPSDGN